MGTSYSSSSSAWSAPGGITRTPFLTPTSQPVAAKPFTYERCEIDKESSELTDIWGQTTEPEGCEDIEAHGELEILDGMDGMLNNIDKTLGF